MSLARKIPLFLSPAPKRSRLQQTETPDTFSDVTYGSDEESEEYDIIQFFPSDILGSIFFGGYVNSLEVVKTASCICKDLEEIAKEKVTMLDLRRCPMMVTSDLSVLTKRFPNLQVSLESSNDAFMAAGERLITFVFFCFSKIGT